MKCWRTHIYTFLIGCVVMLVLCIYLCRRRELDLQRRFMAHSVDWHVNAKKLQDTDAEVYCLEQHLKTLELVRGYACPHPLLLDMKRAGVYAAIAEILDRDGNTVLRDQYVGRCATVSQRIIGVYQNAPPGWWTRARFDFLSDSEFQEEYWRQRTSGEQILEWGRTMRRMDWPDRAPNEPME